MPPSFMGCWASGDHAAANVLGGSEPSAWIRRPHDPPQAQALRAPPDLRPATSMLTSTASTARRSRGQPIAAATWRRCVDRATRSWRWHAGSEQARRLRCSAPAPAPLRPDVTGLCSRDWSKRRSGLTGDARGPGRTIGFSYVRQIHPDSRPQCPEGTVRLRPRTCGVPASF